MISLYAQSLYAFEYNAQDFKKIEQKYQGTLSISAIQLNNEFTINYNENKQLPFQSTFKALLTAIILKQAQNEEIDINKIINFTEQELVTWSPITKEHLNTGMTIKQLAKAAMEHSDNTATNLLITELGGLAIINEQAHYLGNLQFSLENYEPYLNSNPAIIDDTSTTLGMTKMISNIITTEYLDSNNRQQWLEWMLNNTTGFNRIRAGVPEQWLVADRTGSSNNFGITNAIGIIWPPNSEPLIISIFFASKNSNQKPQDEIISLSTKAIISKLNDFNY